MIALLEAMRRHVAAGLGQGGAVGAEIARVLAALDSARPWSAASVPPSLHPSLRALAAFGDKDAILDGCFLPRAAHLPWRYGYESRPDAPGLEDRMAWAELIGPKAPIVSNAVGFGLTLIGPWTYYRPHRHPAVELYAVVAGTAFWTADGITDLRPPGSFILHPENVVHAMQTKDEPLLAVYSWTGDIVSPSVWE